MPMHLMQKLCLQVYLQKTISKNGRRKLCFPPFSIFYVNYEYSYQCH